MKKKFVLILVSLALLLSLAACKQTDVVGNASITSFNEILSAMEGSVASDNGGWVLTSPTGRERFFWSKDFSASTADVLIEFDAKPFLDAGLNVLKLPEGMVQGDKIIIGSNLGDEQLTYKKDITPISSYEKIVEQKREKIKYHADLDHYGVEIGDGNMFEWAKDMNTNDKDIVFALNPKVFIDAGVDPAKVEGWAFAKVKTMDADRKPIEVDKFLKPFNIK